jgi:hypothetical protein
LLCVLDELVLQALLSRPSLFRVLYKAFRNEVLKKWGPTRIFQSRWILLNDLKKNFSLRFALVRWLSVSQLYGKNAKTPNINLAIILSLTFNKFRCHPIDGAHSSVPSILFLS